MIEFKATHLAPIKLGHTGETEAVRVAFSLAPFEEAFPGGRPALLVRRKGDAQAYPVTLTVEGDTAYWTVAAADTAAAGFGQCELQWYAGDTLAKSDKFDFLVVQALEAGAEPPDAPSKRWFDAIQSQIGDLNELTTRAKENLVAAINEAAKTGSGGAGSIDMQVSGGYIRYSTDGGTTWENLIAVADLKGEPGEDGAPGNPGEDGKPGSDGYSPVAKVEETADGAKITITDKTGTTEATVKNGKDGADGVPGKDGKDGTDGAPGKDGSNGITPTIGTNGNWYLGTEDTGNPSRGAAGAPGAAGHTPEITAEKSGKVTTIKADGTAIAEISDGSDGAPGKDGAGMDITGAAAGQIAKITAVDENGVPTAWEPVDMPSGGGGGEWVLAGSVTAESAGTVLKVSNIHAKHILVSLYASCDETSGKSYQIKLNDAISAMRAGALPGNGEKHLWAVEFELLTAGDENYIYCRVWPNEAHHANKSNDPATTMYTTTTDGTMWYRTSISEFNSVTFQSGNGTPSAGNIMNVWYR